IGNGIARGLTSAGSDIVIAARDEAKTARAVQEIKEKFDVRAMGVRVDVRQEKSIKEMVQQTVEAFGKIDILVNNAGVNIRKMPEEFSREEWDEVLEINLRGAFLCSQAVYPTMKENGGKIINIGSMTSIVGAAKAAPYSCSKAAIVKLTSSLAIAWARDNIQVNTILPGWIDTPLTAGSRKAFPGLDNHVESRTPAGRWGSPEDFAGPAVFLASAASDFVTGASLAVDGGYSQSTLIV
ncbi:MAG: SDR family oxidoreductase, partial [Deltaproteobacteria bacterium]|nr:SDR family oxidoreductase [Deltaproteobacteria bacterium]